MLRISPQAAETIRGMRPNDDALDDGRAKLRVALAPAGELSLSVVDEQGDDDLVTVSEGIHLCVEPAADQQVGELVLDVRATDAHPEFVFRTQ